MDLTLLPLRDLRAMGDTHVLCYDRLSFDRDYKIFGQLMDMTPDEPKPTIKANPIPPQMWVETYEDEGVRETREDKYGTELTFVYAQQLKKLKVTTNSSPKNKAVKAFIDALPDQTAIILFWH